MLNLRDLRKQRNDALRRKGEELIVAVIVFVRRPAWPLFLVTSIDTTHIRTSKILFLNGIRAAGQHDWAALKPGEEINVIVPARRLS